MNFQTVNNILLVHRNAVFITGSLRVETNNFSDCKQKGRFSLSDLPDLQECRLTFG